MSRSVLRTAPWLRAPVLLLPRPVVFAAIVAATVILAIAAASGPLFLSTVATASLDAQARQACPEKSRPGVVAELPGRDLTGTTQRLQAAMATRNLPNRRAVEIGETHVQQTLVHTFAAPGALSHVHRLTRGVGPGAWVPDTFASKLGLRPGSTMRTANGPVRVAGLYRDLAPDPFALAHLPRFFCTWTDAIVQKVTSETAPAASSAALTPGPLLITDPATVARLSDRPRLYLHSRFSTREQPPDSAAAAVQRARAAVRATPVDAGSDVEVDGGLPGLIVRARSARSGIAGSVLPIEVAGVIIAGLLVGSAGLFWANARGREVRLLVARGVGPVPLATKAVLETLPAALLGGFAGWALSMVLVRAVGPASVFERDAPLRALGVTAIVLALGLLLVGIVGGAAGRDRSSARPGLRRFSRAPWELVLIVGAVVVAIVRRDSAITVDRAVLHVSPLLVLYPLLGATGVLVLLGRVVGVLLPIASRSAGRGPVAWYLALRRMSRSRVIAVGLLVGTALPCSLLMYAATVRAAVEHEVTTKYQSNLGAPHVLQIYGVHTASIDTHGTGSHVVRYEQDVTFGDGSATVMGVDTATFERFAYLTADQRTDLGRLGSTGQGPVPAIVANAVGNTSTAVQIASSRLSLRVVARPRVFPGVRYGSDPLIIVERRALRAIDDTAAERTDQIWTDAGHYAAARQLIANLRYSVLFELTPQVVIGTTGLLPVTWIFGYLQSLAILIAVVAVAGLVFGLAARTRSRRVSYVLSRRMGLRRVTHVRSLLVELGLVLGLGWAAGSALGLGSFGLLLDRLDVYPRLPPPPAFVVPTAPLTVSAIAVVAVTLFAALATHVLAERTKPAEILRLE